MRYDKAIKKVFKARGHSRSKQKTPVAWYRVWVDGAGAGPNGLGSGYAWVRERVDEKSVTRVERVRRVDGLTNNQAEFRALIYALRNLPIGSHADISADSQLMVNQFNGEWEVKNDVLAHLLDRAREIIQERDLEISLKWVPREQNVAGKLL
jgi:ribonuclease HI